MLRFLCVPDLFSYAREPGRSNDVLMLSGGMHEAVLRVSYSFNIFAFLGNKTLGFCHIHLSYMSKLVFTSGRGMSTFQEKDTIHLRGLWKRLITHTGRSEVLDIYSCPH